MEEVRFWEEEGRGFHCWWDMGFGDAGGLRGDGLGMGEKGFKRWGRLGRLRVMRLVSEVIVFIVPSSSRLVIVVVEKEKDLEWK